MILVKSFSLILIIFCTCLTLYCTITVSLLLKNICSRFINTYPRTHSHTYSVTHDPVPIHWSSTNSCALRVLECAFNSIRSTPSPLLITLPTPLSLSHFYRHSYNSSFPFPFNIIPSLIHYPFNIAFTPFHLTFFLKSFHTHIFHCQCILHKCPVPRIIACWYQTSWPLGKVR